MRVRRPRGSNNSTDMNLRSSILGGCAGILLCSLAFGQNPAGSNQTGKETSPAVPATSKAYAPQLVEKGAAIFRQDCSFCHGRDAGGGESGPDLTRSKLVSQDTNGDKIGAVVRSGRPDKGMPPFQKSDDEIQSLVAFIHTQQNAALVARVAAKAPEDEREWMPPICKRGMWTLANGILRAQED